jgi:hypothetical protein
MERRFRVGETVFDVIGNKYMITGYYLKWNQSTNRYDYMCDVKSHTCVVQRAWEGVLYSIEEYGENVKKERNRTLEKILQ